MAQSVTISAPFNATAIPCTAAGSAFPSNNATIRGMAYQINAGPMNPIPVPNPNGGNWSFQLTPRDCPMVGILYQLTVYEGDSSGSVLTNVAQFIRSA